VPTPLTLPAAATALAALLAAGAAGEPPASGTGELRVAVSVVGADGRAAPAPNAVVWIADGAARPGAAAPPSTRPRIASKNKRFDPRITAVRAGTTVEFPNLDGIFHNVFSLSPGATFDLGLYRNGATRSMTFDTPGLVRVYCNIHPQMAAYLLVLDGTIWARTGADGSAVLANVPAGRATVRAWDERGGEYRGTVDVAAGKPASLAIALDGSNFKETPHLNKHGRPYPPPDDDANRY
jgi:plastocyanin